MQSAHSCSLRTLPKIFADALTTELFSSRSMSAKSLFVTAKQSIGKIKLVSIKSVVGGKVHKYSILIFSISITNQLSNSVWEYD